jgi:hypothetical protein
VQGSTNEHDAELSGKTLGINAHLFLYHFIKLNELTYTFI